MDKFIHRENLALYRKRLAEDPDDATREIILRLLAQEEAKDGADPTSLQVAASGKPSNAA
jgi:hypothetical protein